MHLHAVSAPVVTGTTPTTDTTPTWTWSSGGGGGSGSTSGSGTFRYKLGDSDFSIGATTNTDTSFTQATALADGSYTLYVQEQETGGAWSTTGSHTIVVDTTPPSPPVVGGTTPTTDTTPTWTWISGGGGNGNFRYKLDNNDFSSGTTPTTNLSFTPSTALSPGSRTLYVQERDAAGNWSTSGSFTIEVDTTPPDPPSVTGTTPTSDTTPTWTWTSGGGGNGTYRYKLDDSNLNSGASTTTDTSFTPGSALSDGAHILYVQERDAAGNWSSSGSSSITIDSTGPTAPSVTGNSPTNDTTPTWSWTSGGGGNGTFRYKLGDGNLATGSTETSATEFTPTTPLSEGSHTLYVQERDALENWSSSGSASITIDLTPPDPPLVSVTSPTSDTTPTWSWSSGGGGNGTYRYKLGDSNLNSGATVVTGTGFTPATPLTDGAHTLYVQERDAAGNWSSSASATVTIDTQGPNAPIVSGSALTNDNTPTWTWSTGGNGGTGTYRYRLDNSDLSSVSTETTGTSFTPGSAISDGEHTLYVQERDTLGNWSNNGSFTLTVDTIPPNPPVVTGDAYTADTTPTWTWTSGGGGGSGTFRYKLDNSNLGSGATETTLGSFTPGTALSEAPHVLYVQERDAAGNWSTSGSFTSTIDLTAPTIVWNNPPSSDLNNPTTHTEGTYTIGYTLTETNLKTLKVVFDRDGGVDQEDLISPADGSHDFMAWGSDSGLYALHLVAIDQLDRTATTAIYYIDYNPNELRSPLWYLFIEDVSDGSVTNHTRTDVYRQDLFTTPHLQWSFALVDSGNESAYQDVFWPGSDPFISLDYGTVDAADFELIDLEKAVGAPGRVIRQLNPTDDDEREQTSPNAGADKIVHVVATRVTELTGDRLIAVKIRDAHDIRKSGNPVLFTPSRMTSPGWIIDRTPPAAHTIAALPRGSDPIRDLSFSVSDRDLDNDGFQDASLLQPGSASTLDVAVYARLLGDTTWTGPLSPAGVMVPGLLTDAPVQTIAGVAAADVDFGNLVGAGEHATVEYAIRVSDRAGNFGSSANDAIEFGTVEIDRKPPVFSSANPPRNSAVSPGSRVATVTMDESVTYATSFDPLTTSVLQLWRDGVLETSYLSSQVTISGSQLSLPVTLSADATYELRTTASTLQDLYDNVHSPGVMARWYTAPSGEPTITGTLAADVSDTGLVIPATVLGATTPGATSAEILFTLATPPTTGALVLNGIALPTGGTWTLADIEAGRFGFRKLATEGGVTVQAQVRLSRLATPTSYVDSAWLTLSLEAVNAPPNLDLNASEASYDDVANGLSPVLLFPAATTNDSEGFSGGSLSIALNPNEDGDRLSIATDSTIVVSGSAVDHDSNGGALGGRTTIAVITAAGAGQPLTFALQSGADGAKLSALLQRIRYHHATPATLSPVTKRVTVSISDASGDSSSASLDLRITALDDPPQNPRLLVDGSTSFIVPVGMSVIQPLTATDPEGKSSLRFLIDPGASLGLGQAEIVEDSILRFTSTGGIGNQSFTIHVTDRPASIAWSDVLADPSAFTSAVFTARIGGNNGNILIPHGDPPLSLPATGTALYPMPVNQTGSVNPMGFSYAFSGKLPSGLNISTSSTSITLLWNAASGPAPSSDTVYAGGIVGYRLASGAPIDVFFIPLTLVLPGLPSGGG